VEGKPSDDFTVGLARLANCKQSAPRIAIARRFTRRIATVAVQKRLQFGFGRVAMLCAAGAGKA
jgi:hypothetical protein